MGFFIVGVEFRTKNYRVFRPPIFLMESVSFLRGLELLCGLLFCGFYYCACYDASRCFLVWRAPVLVLVPEAETTLDDPRFI